MSHLVDIIIPTWDNPQYVYPAVESILTHNSATNLFHIHLVNNGHPQSCDWLAKDHPLVSVLQTGGINLGWEGALELGLKSSSAPYVCFFNDDAYIPPSSRTWLNQLLQHFKDPKVGAVGPASNVVVGPQNIFASVPFHSFSAKFLIGFCLLVKRSVLEQVGGVDITLPGGDDLDLSIRLRDAGYKLMVDREVFVFHHGFKTGERVHGDPSKPNGWNSYEFKEKTDLALIRKHGLIKWWDCLKGAWEMPKTADGLWGEEDTEAKLVAERVSEETVLELGCGGKKTVPHSIGLDMVKYDDIIETLSDKPKSVADIQHDVSEPLPFEEGSVDTIIARHILEHMIDPLTAVKHWIKSLKVGGRLIVAVPDENHHRTIPMNIEHLHAWTPESMRVFLETVGLKVIDQLDSQNGVSFISVGEKV